MPKLTPKGLHARLISTRDLLIEIAQENQNTVRALTAADIDADTWFAYRKLSDVIQSAAQDATLLAATIDPKHTANDVAYHAVNA